MKEIVEILKYVIPSVVVFLTAYYMLKYMLQNQYKLMNHQQWVELNKDKHKRITPIRLRAYERIILFLERISPDRLVIRINKGEMTNKQLHFKLVKTINEEFNHNLSQQIYISNEAWHMVKNAKESTIQFLNITGTKIKPDNSAIELSKVILRQVIALKKKVPTQIAIEGLKNEVRQLF